MTLKKRRILFAVITALLIVAISVVIVLSRTPKESIHVPNILGAWYSTDGTDETIMFYDDYDCVSSLADTEWSYTILDSEHVEITKDDKTSTTFQIILDDDTEKAVRLTSGDQSYIRDPDQAAAEAKETGSESYAEYNIEIALPKILQADVWTLDGGQNNETLQFEPDRVHLTWNTGNTTHSRSWAWTYLDIFADQDVDKPISIKMQLTSLESDAQSTDMLYLYTNDSENGFRFESTLFSDTTDTVQCWTQAASEQTLTAADDSNQEGENVIIAGSGGAGAPTTYSDSYDVAADDPFSESFVEPKPGDIDPETGKKIKTYVRMVSGDTCTITIVYDDDTSSTQTIEKQVNVDRQKVDISY